MKEKNARLELRLSAKEKAQLESIAKKCGLPVSEYLRKRGLGYEPGPLLNDRFYEVYSKLCEISNLPLQPDTEAVLISILNDLQQNLFLPRKQTQKEIVEEVNGDPAKPALRGKEDPRSASLSPLAATVKDGG